ncbi:fibronectin type III domain-containing protein [Paenibacillus sp. S-38]|uniref:fibronectin type III domain-containing protein n=1 Tax=Paenibacillus sp. S-38 TaxID=3416710 RepID=UPI003CEF4794
MYTLATNRWVMACGLIMLLLLPSSVYAEVPPAPDIAAPYADTRQDTLLEIEVRDSGTVSRMTASVGDRGIGLVRICAEQCSWVGRLDLRGLSKGPQTLLVKAEDPSGGASEAAQPFFLVPKPYVLVSPSGGTTLTDGTMQAQVTPYSYPQDPDSLVIEGGLSAPDGKIIASFSGQGNVNQSLALPSDSGPELHYQVNVFDEQHNLLSEELHLLYREPEGVLEERGRIPGEIVDYDRSRILYRGAAGDLFLRQEGGGPDTVVFPAGLGSAGFAALTPEGAVVLASGLEAGSVYTWKERKLSLVREGAGERAEVRGRYLLLDEGDGVNRSVLDSSTGSLRTYDSSLYREGVLEEDGGVLFVSAGTISRLAADGSVQPVVSGAGEAAGLVADGEQVLFLSGQRLLQYDGSTLKELTDGLPGGAAPHLAYESAGGWTAYLVEGAEGLQAVLIPPEGAPVTSSLSLAQAEIAGLSGDGTLYLRGGGRLWQLKPGEASPREAGSDRGKLKVLEGRGYKALGDTLFAVSTTAGGQAGPQWPSGGTLTAPEIRHDAAVLKWQPASVGTPVPQRAASLAEEAAAAGGQVTAAVYGGGGRIAEYRIYRDGVLAGTVSGRETRFRVEGLQPATTYRFSVEARDAAGRLSTGNPEVSVTTAVYAPAQPLSLSRKPGPVSRGSVVELKIRAPQADEVYGFFARLKYDPARFKLVSSELDSSFGRESAGAVLGRRVSGGTASFSGVKLGRVPGASGEDLGLLTLKLQALQAGESQLILQSGSQLMDGSGRPEVLKEPVSLSVTVSGS